MTLLEAVAILAAGLGAGTINAVVGSGTLITFPVLLAVGYSPVVANVSNTVGLVPGSVAGSIGYRRELEGQGGRLARLSIASTIGGVIGAVLLLELPESAFEAIVPAFIVLALVLIVAQPWLARRLSLHRPESVHGGPLVAAAALGTGVYGGYFGAAQGIMLVGVLGVALPEDLQRINALKNVLTGLVNLVSGLVFIVAAAHVAWGAALLVAVGATVGGHLGARYGRRLSPAVLRAVIVVVGVSAIVQLLV